MIWYEVKFGDVWRTFYKLIKNFSWVLQTKGQHVTCDFPKKKKKKMGKLHSSSKRQPIRNYYLVFAKLQILSFKMLYNT